MTILEPAGGQVAAVGARSGSRVIAIIRLPGGHGVVRVGQELVEAGVGVLEVTLTTPGALDAVTHLQKEFAGAGAVIGAGSVRTVDDARRAIDAGAQFLVTPTTRVEVLEAATVPVICGAFTPTEIDLAWSAGAASVKLFPANLGGPAYLRDVRAPLPDVPIVPTGGITPANLGEYARAGAVAVGVGSALVDAAIVAACDWVLLRSRAEEFRAAVEVAQWSGP